MSMRRRNPITRIVLALLFAIALRLHADDWPTYQHDVARSGVTEEELAMPLSQTWNFVPLHPPAPAWGDPQPKPIEGNLELPRMKFDDAFHVVAAGGWLYFGSSSDNTVYCLDAATGEIKWTRITGAPIRLAPTVWQGKVYVCSDDGYAYCLDAKDGREIWKFRAGPTDEKLLGHGKMISMWPLRTGILVDDGIAYFTAGVFPHEGLYFYAVRAADGKRIWVNDSFGWTTAGGVSPQGYLLASASNLFVPSGRSAPAAFDRKDGRFLYQGRGNWRGDGLFGGTYALLADGQLYSGTEQIIAYEEAKGATGFAWFHGRRLVVTPDTSYMLSGTEMSALDRATFPAASQERQKFRRLRWKLDNQASELQKAIKAARRKAEGDAKAAEQVEALEKQVAALKPQLDELTENENKAAKQVERTKTWRADCDCAESLILAGATLFAGGQDKIIAVEAETGRTLWTGKVNGKAKGLAVADGRLFVSTDQGDIHCFAPGEAAKARRIDQPKEPAPSAEDKRCEELAESILKDTGIKKGYCLLIGAGTGRLAHELAKYTELTIYVAEEDAQKAEEARKALSAAGIYGARVCVDHGTLEGLCYPDYFANLIICESENMSATPEELLRVLKPLGGVAYVPAGLKSRLGALNAPDARVRAKGEDWITLTRGRLEGAGSWTHEYAEPGNTACSDDTRLKGPLGLLWFGEPGPGRIPSRHASAASPLSTDGRLFIQGENVILCHDAYNGLKLWERDIPGAIRVGTKQECGNLAATDDSLFVAVNDKCLRLDAATGETTKTYDLPPSEDGKARRWGYVAVVGDTLYGSATPTRVVCDTLFAFDLKTGRPRWVHNGKTIMNVTIAIGDGKLFFIEQTLTDEERRSANTPNLANVRMVTALDAGKGALLWQQPVDVTDCIKIGIGSGDTISLIYKNNILLLCMVPWNGHFWKEFMAGDFSRRSIIALSADKGEMLWSEKIGYRSRPLVIGDTIYAEPWAYDLKTGKPRMRTHPITGKEEKWQISRSGHHCGCMAAAPNLLMFRSASIAYYDLIQDYGVANFGGPRPGCWISFVAANGLMLAPEASSGCVCPFPVHCTVALHPRKTDRAWGVYSCPGPLTPVKHIAVNLGAHGDRKDGKGTLWLAYPRPAQGRLALEFNLGANIMDGGGYYTHSAELAPIEGTDAPWLFTSGCAGLTRCTVPLVGKGEAPGEYTVRLRFAELAHGEPGRRVFDIKLQDRLVAKNFDIVKEAEGRSKALVKEFKGVGATGDLKIDLVPKEAAPDIDQAPLLCAIEAERARTLPLSLAVPPFLLSDYQREQTREARIINFTDEEFVGRLQAKAPAGFRVEPKQAAVRVPAKGEAAVPLQAAMTGKRKPGQFEIGLKLTRQGGGVEIETVVLVDYAGAQGEIVLKAAADAFVRKGAPEANYGASKALYIDGGHKEMDDEGHSITFVKFRLDVPGKPISARLRMQVGTSGHSQSSDSGCVYLVKGAWDEKTITYANKPELGEKVGVIGKTENGELIERDLDLDLDGLKELSLAVAPTSPDGAGYVSKEGGSPPELIVKLGER